MEYAYDIIEISMNMLGVCLEYAHNMLGSLEYARTMLGICMEYLYNILEISMNMLGACLEYACPGRPKSAQRLSATYPHLHFGMQFRI